MYSDGKNNNDVDLYSQIPTPNPTYLPTNLPHRAPQQLRYALAAKALLQTVDLDLHNLHEWAILDSGATSHFLVSAAPTRNRQFTTSPLKVRLPDGGYVSSTHTCDLDLPLLPTKARLGHIIPGLASHSLLSVVKLCNAGCEVTFTKVQRIVKH